MAKKIKATHRLRRPHQVHFDPMRHFLPKGDAPETGDRVTLPAGTHMIPTEGQLIALPDRFESLASPAKPAEVTVNDESADDDDDEPDDDEVADDDLPSEADRLVDVALSEVSDDWSALTSVQLADLADGYGIKAGDIVGSGSSGNVLKADWITTVRKARGAVA